MSDSPMMNADMKFDCSGAGKRELSGKARLWRRVLLLRYFNGIAHARVRCAVGHETSRPQAVASEISWLPTTLRWDGGTVCLAL
jgi:hypothetical protein